jgi:hypothetical protein
MAGISTKVQNSEKMHLDVPIRHKVFRKIFNPDENLQGGHTRCARRFATSVMIVRGLLHPPPLEVAVRLWFLMSAIA